MSETGQIDKDLYRSIRNQVTSTINEDKLRRKDDKDTTRKGVHYYGRVRTLTQHAYSRELARRAYTDKLTQILNREGLEVIINREHAQAEREKHPLSLLFIDLDNFRKWNTSYGHDMGDKVLQRIAEILNTRLSDFKSRIESGRTGGDEFVAVLPGADMEGAKIAANRFAENLAKAEWNQVNDDMKISFCIGVSSFDPNAGNVSVDELIKQSDTAMYHAKEDQHKLGNGSIIRSYEPGMIMPEKNND